MLLLITNTLTETVDAYNKTFGSTEVTCFTTHTQGLSLYRLSIRPARNNTTVIFHP